MATAELSYKWGFLDGKIAATSTYPAHEGWKKDRSGKITHFNSQYLAGYKAGYVEQAGITPYCF